MRTILIAHRETAFAEALATELRHGGYRVLTCPGPWPPVERCIRCDVGYCPLTEGADLMIYEPQLTALDQAGRRHNLAVDSALAQPDVPLLLAWSPGCMPDPGALRAIRAEVPRVRVAAHEPAALRRQVDELLAAPSATR